MSVCLVATGKVAVHHLLQTWAIGPSIVTLISSLIDGMSQSTGLFNDSDTCRELNHLQLNVTRGTRELVVIKKKVPRF